MEISPNMEYIDIQTHYRRQVGFIGNLHLI